MDLETMVKHVNERKYPSAEAFLADVKWIVHNTCICTGSKWCFDEESLPSSRLFSSRCVIVHCPRTSRYRRSWDNWISALLSMLSTEYSIECVRLVRTILHATAYIMLGENENLSTLARKGFPYCRRSSGRAILRTAWSVEEELRAARSISSFLVLGFQSSNVSSYRKNIRAPRRSERLDSSRIVCWNCRSISTSWDNTMERSPMHRHEQRLAKPNHFDSFRLSTVSDNNSKIMIGFDRLDSVLPSYMTEPNSSSGFLQRQTRSSTSTRSNRTPPETRMIGKRGSESSDRDLPSKRERFSSIDIEDDLPQPGRSRAIQRDSSLCLVYEGEDFNVFDILKPEDEIVSPTDR